MHDSVQSLQRSLAQSSAPRAAVISAHGPISTLKYMYALSLQLQPIRGQWVIRCVAANRSVYSIRCFRLTAPLVLICSWVQVASNRRVRSATGSILFDRYHKLNHLTQPSHSWRQAKWSRSCRQPL
jgi:hypothetical protein